MIRLENLRHVASDGIPLLNGITLSIGRGERTGLIGPSGSGKTTLGYHLCGIHDRVLTGRSEGRIRLAGQEPGSGRRHGFAGLVMQNPEPQLFGQTVEEEIGLGLENLGRTPREVRAAVDRLLDLMDLAPLRKARIDSLSLGLKQRLSIAAMLAMKPRVLFLDEPTNFLDQPSADRLFALLRRLEPDVTVIIAEHDLERLAAWATRIIALERGGITADGPPGSVLAGRRHPLETVPRVPRAEPLGEPLLTATNLVYAHGKTTVLDGVSLAVHPGEIVAVTGVNGSGKTTLLHLLKGLLKPRSGEAWMADGLPLMESVGLVFQNPDEQIFAATVAEECGYLLRNRRVPETERVSRTLAALRGMGLENKAERLPLTLSYGEKRRLALASILVGDPRVLCLDEPTAALDDAGLRGLIRIFSRLAGEGRGIVFATHDHRFARAAATRRIVLHAGRLIANLPARREAA